MIGAADTGNCSCFSEEDVRIVVRAQQFYQKRYTPVHKQSLRLPIDCIDDKEHKQYGNEILENVQDCSVHVIEHSAFVHEELLFLMEFLFDGKKFLLGDD